MLTLCFPVNSNPPCTKGEKGDISSNILQQFWRERIDRHELPVLMITGIIEGKENDRCSVCVCSVGMELELLCGVNMGGEEGHGANERK